MHCSRCFFFFNFYNSIGWSNYSIKKQQTHRHTQKQDTFIVGNYFSTGTGDNNNKKLP